MNKQQGFVSIITASIVMIIITLVVIGFSQIMQREQRQALDRQLSSQAVYAAETAVNDVYAALQLGALKEFPEKLDCDVTSVAWADVFPTGGRVNPGSDNEAAYTCVTFDQTPTSLEFNNGSITTQQSKIFQIQPSPSSVADARVKSLTFQWNGARGETNLSLPQDCPTTLQLPSNASSIGVPILRIDLVRLPTYESVNRDTAIDATTTFFLYPVGTCGGDAKDYDDLVGLTKKGTVIPVKCDSNQAYACSFTLDKMQIGSTSSDRYFARVKSIYNDADLLINGTTVGAGGGTGGVLEFFGAQIYIDATGKSNDVLRRINVQIANPTYPIPEFIVQGLDGVCKNISIKPPAIDSSVVCAY